MEPMQHLIVEATESQPTPEAYALQLFILVAGLIFVYVVGVWVGWQTSQPSKAERRLLARSLDRLLLETQADHERKEILELRHGRTLRDR
jgi:hypothetical protein